MSPSAVLLFLAAFPAAAAPIGKTEFDRGLARHGLRYTGAAAYGRIDERSWDAAGSRRLSAEAGAARLKISSEADADEPSARRRLGEWRARFLGLFEGDAAYPGMVTREVRTPPSLRPRPAEAAGRSVWLAPATERQTFGAGSEDLARYRAVVSQRWCPGARRSVEVALFFPAASRTDGEILAEESRFLCLTDAR